MSFGGQGQLKLAREVAEVSKLLPPPFSRWDRELVDLEHGGETVTAKETADSLFRPTRQRKKGNGLLELPTNGMRPIAEQHHHQTLRLLENDIQTGCENWTTHGLYSFKIKNGETCFIHFLLYHNHISCQVAKTIILPII